MITPLIAPQARGGALSEPALGQRLDDLGSECRVLSHRAIGSSTAQFIVAAPSGVWVIASRRSPSRPAQQGGLLSRRTETLQLGRRNAERLVEAVRKQAEIVRGELGDEVPVGALLCILDADWPIFGGAFTVDGVRVLWPKKARDVIASGASLTSAEVTRIADQLEAAFAPAPVSRSHGRRR